MTTIACGPRIAELIAQNYGDVHPAILRHLLQWVLLMREGFDGDLDLMVVMAVIGDRTLKDLAFRDLGYAELRLKPEIKPDNPLTNRKSIADSTGIPRETVRRKVATLLAKGWIEERPDGTLATTRGATDALHPITLRSFEILGHLGATLAAVRDLDA